MDYLADTVAIVRHLRQHPALGSQAANILHEADQGLHRIYLSAITLMEVLYLSAVRHKWVIEPGNGLPWGLDGQSVHLANKLQYEG